MKLRRLAIFVFVILGGCDDSQTSDDKSPCPPFELIPKSPYSDPAWHPSGNVIGFNHVPIERIDYSYGYDCPLQAAYTYKEDSAGFWLINADGTGQRRVLPYNLDGPAWSPDGKWIAFCKDAQIFKMPFNGTQFDTAGVVQLTFIGRNFFPAWSRDGKYIAYDNTDCGSATTPVPPNSCGVLVMEANGSNTRFAGHGRMPYWNDDSRYLYALGTKFDLLNGTSEQMFDPVALNVAMYGPSMFDHEGTAINFIGHYTNTDTQYSKLFSITTDGAELKTITDENIKGFSRAPEGKIVYLIFDYTRIDEVKGTLWVADADGGNPRQLTFNRFMVLP